MGGGEGGGEGGGVGGGVGNFDFSISNSNSRMLRAWSFLWMSYVV